MINLSSCLLCGDENTVDGYACRSCYELYANEADFQDFSEEKELKGLLRHEDLVELLDVKDAGRDNYD